MKEARSLEWQRLYRKTVSERDPEHLPEGIARAEAAIYLRIKQVPPGKMDEAERQAIRRAACLKKLEGAILPRLEVILRRNLAGVTSYRRSPQREKQQRSIISRNTHVCMSALRYASALLCMRRQCIALDQATRSNDRTVRERPEVRPPETPLGKFFLPCRFFIALARRE
jgi:hypothetical protein